MTVPSDPLLLAIIQVAACAIPACALAMLLRRTDAPGGPRAAGVVAGIVVGLLLGPSVAGRVAPDLYDPVYRGAVVQQQRVTELVREQQGEIVALHAAGADRAAIADAMQRHETEREPLRRAMLQARRVHREGLMWLVIGLVVAHVALSGVVKAPTSSRAMRVIAHALVRARAAPLAIGALLVLFSIGPPALIGATTGIVPLASALAFGIVFGIPGIAATLRPTDYLVTGFALLLALIACVPAGFSLQMVGVGGAVLASGLLPTGLPSRAVRAMRRRVPSVLDALLVPPIVAMCLVTLDVYDLGASGTFWVALLVAIVWSSDGRWMAGALAYRLVQRTAERNDAWRRATRILDAGAGLAQLFAAIVFTASGVLPGEVLGAAIAGTALIELTSGARRWILGTLSKPTSDA